MKFCSCLVKCLALCACLVGVVWAQTPLDPERKGAVAQAKVEARQLFDQGKGQESYNLYIRLLRIDPDDDEINLGLARSAILAKRGNQAVMAYERLLEKYPNESSLHRGIADAYTLLGASELAAQHLALSKGGETAGDVLLASGKENDRLQVYGRLRAGLIHDNNANLGPASNNISLGNWNDVRLSDAKAQSTVGAYLGAQVDVGYRLDQVSPWWWVGDAQLYVRGNERSGLSKINAQHNEWARGALGIRRLSDTTLFDVRLKAEIFDYAFKDRITAFGPELTFLYVAEPQWHLITRVGSDWRNYLSANERDGWYSYAGQYLRFLFGNPQHEMTVGLRYLGGNARLKMFSSDGVEASLVFNFTLPNKMQFSPSLSYTHEWYKGPGTVLETEKRRDSRWRAGFDLTVPLDKSWSIEVGYHYTKNHSKSNLYKYGQHLAMAGMAWRF